MRRTTVILLVGALAVSACGRRDVLVPAQGAALPVKPQQARVQPTVDDLLRPTPTARPARNEEILRRADERPDDRFDLPPAG